MTQTSYALVTGASRGLGKYFARALAARQLNVVLVARDNDRWAALAAELEMGHGVRADTLALALPSAGPAGPLAEQLKERGLTFLLLLTNPALGDHVSFHRLPTIRPLSIVNLH